MSDASKRCRDAGKMIDERNAYWLPLWQSLANYTQPRKSQILAKKTPSTIGYTQEIYDTTIIDANNKLAAALVSATTPMTTFWFAFEAPNTMRDEPLSATAEPAKNEAEAWWQQVTKITAEVLSQSTFYSSYHEAHLDRCSFGTCCLYIEEGENVPLRVISIQIGTYAMRWDMDGQLRKVVRRFELEADQAIEMFGAEALPERIRNQAVKEPTRKLTFIHTVERRSEEERDANPDGELSLPFASYYDLEKEKFCVQESGYHEMPYMISKFLSFPGEKFGWGPGIEGLPLAKQMNFIKRQIVTLIEKQAFPPVLIPSNMFGQVDMRAAGVTVFDESSAQYGLPREWQTAGNSGMAEKLLEMLEQQLRNLFYLDLFQMLQNLNQDRMTAYEVMQRVSEKLDQFSPSYQRIITELLSPMLLRIFLILFRAGKFPKVPDSVKIPIDDKTDAIPQPSVAYKSKLALMLRAHANKSFADLWNLLTPMFAENPAIVDNFDTDEISRDLAANQGVPPKWINSDQKRNAIRAQRIAAQKQQQALMQTQQLAEATAKLGKAPKALQEQVMNNGTQR